MISQVKPTGLREQIKSAETPAEVSYLLNSGRQFEQASDKTRRRWNTTAKRRTAELEKGVSK